MNYLKPWIGREHAYRYLTAEEGRAIEVALYFAKDRHSKGVFVSIMPKEFEPMYTGGPMAERFCLTDMIGSSMCVVPMARRDGKQIARVAEALDVFVPRLAEFHARYGKSIAMKLLKAATLNPEAGDAVFETARLELMSQVSDHLTGVAHV